MGKTIVMLRLTFIVFTCQMPSAHIKNSHIRLHSEREQHVYRNAHYQDQVIHGIEVTKKKTTLAFLANDHGFKLKLCVKI